MTDNQVTTAIANLASGTPNTALELRDLFTELFNRAPKTGTIVIKDVSNAYITANFDGTGLGINIESGYAICNSNNTTRNWDGRVPLGYGGTYLTMGATGGSKDAVVIAHEHTSKISNVTGVDTNKFTAQNGGSGGGATSNNGSGIINTSTTGVVGTDKNMQPYIVTLITMKL